MIVNYSDSKVIKSKKSIFLAGPTPRRLDIKNWRKEAIKILEKLDFDGVVYVPEYSSWKPKESYVDQAMWERKALYNASIIVFWIPRSEALPGFTTNVEFGYWIAKNKNKVIYGRPDDSEKHKYLDWLYETETKKIPFNDLQNLLQEAIKMTN